MTKRQMRPEVVVPSEELASSICETGSHLHGSTSTRLSRPTGSESHLVSRPEPRMARR
jgi:hypothetical protein